MSHKVCVCVGAQMYMHDGDRGYVRERLQPMRPDVHTCQHTISGIFMSCIWRVMQGALCMLCFDRLAYASASQIIRIVAFWGGERY